jgi:hypothetical protein
MDHVGQDEDSPVSWLEVDVTDLSSDEQVKVAASMRRLRGVPHPHVIQVNKSGLSAAVGKLILITESISPNTVERSLLANGKVPLATAQLWATQVASPSLSIEPHSILCMLCDRAFLMTGHQCFGITTLVCTSNCAWSSAL